MTITNPALGAVVTVLAWIGVSAILYAVFDEVAAWFDRKRWDR